MRFRRCVLALGAAASFLLVGTAAPVRAVPEPIDLTTSTAAALTRPDTVVTVPVGGPALNGTGVVVRLGHGMGPPPSLGLPSYLIADATTGEVLAAKAPHLRLRPASTLKTLTAVTLLPRLDPTTVHVGTKEDENIEGTRVGIKVGYRYTVEQLWEGLLLTSGNDAANALATEAGGVPVTLRLMREKAHELRALDTMPTTPSGLDNDNGPGPYSSAYDLALIARAGLRLPAFRHYVSTRLAQFPAGPGKSYQIANMNRLLASYPGALGVKNGYTSKAHHTFVGAASRDRHTLIAVLMAGDQHIQQDTARLLSWGFTVTGKITPVGRLVEPLSWRPVPDIAQAAALPGPGPSITTGRGGVPATPVALAAAVLLAAPITRWWFRRRRVSRHYR